MYDPNDMEKSFKRMALAGLGLALALIGAGVLFGYVFGVLQ